MVGPFAPTVFEPGVEEAVTGGRGGGVKVGDGSCGDSAVAEGITTAKPVGSWTSVGVGDASRSRGVWVGALTLVTISVGDDAGVGVNETDACEVLVSRPTSAAGSGVTVSMAQAKVPTATKGNVKSIRRRIICPHQDMPGAIRRANCFSACNFRRLDHNIIRGRINAG